MNHVKVLVSQSCLTLCDPMDYSSPGSSVHGTVQARKISKRILKKKIRVLIFWASLIVQLVKNLPAMQETRV